MYRPIVAMDVAAENATALPRLGKAWQKLSVHASHTGEGIDVRPRFDLSWRLLPVRTGDLRFASTL